MKKKVVIIASLFFLMAGCAALGTFEEREQIYGKEIPIITKSFASKQMAPGETWKVYLTASDPGGDMNYIVASIEQPGKEAYPPSYTKIAEGLRKELSGYVYLNTMGIEGLNFGNITLHLQIKDKAGHLSAPASFPLSFNYRDKQEKPPSGEFKEVDLGPIMIKLKPFMYDTDKSVSWE